MSTPVGNRFPHRQDSAGLQDGTGRSARPWSKGPGHPESGGNPHSQFSGQVARSYIHASRARCERPVLPLCARSVRSVSVGAVFDGYDGDLALLIIDAVDHAVITTASAVKPLEA